MLTHLSEKGKICYNSRLYRYCSHVWRWIHLHLHELNVMVEAVLGDAIWFSDWIGNFLRINEMEAKIRMVFLIIKVWEISCNLSDGFSWNWVIEPFLKLRRWFSAVCNWHFFLSLRASTYRRQESSSSSSSVKDASNERKQVNRRSFWNNPLFLLLIRL